jgi:hypothetical protein
MFSWLIEVVGRPLIGIVIMVCKKVLRQLLPQNGLRLFLIDYTVSFPATTPL